MVCFQETSQTRAAIREVKVLQSCQLYPAKSNSGLRRRVKSALPGVLVIESCRLTMQMKLGLLHVTSKTTRERQIPVGTRESSTDQARRLR